MILEVKNLYREYERKNKTKFNAVEDISFSLKKGTLTSITGPSGSGTSTLFHMLSGLVKVSSGEIYLNNRCISNLSENELANIRNSELGYIMQGSNLIPNLTIIENICIPTAFSSENKDVYERGRMLLEAFGLKGIENEFPANLSDGEQKRVSIARTFAQNPSFVIADEPTSNLDEENTIIIMEFFKKMCKEGVTILFSTHEKELLRFADENIKIYKGKLL
jgi:putative ABC transport system ATP-binding protein